MTHTARRRTCAALFLAAGLTVFAATPAAAHIAIGGEVPVDGTTVNYTVTRCAEINNGPQIDLTSWEGFPGSGLYTWVRRPADGVRLGPKVWWPDLGGGFKQHGPLGLGQCFRISADREGGNSWDWGTWSWTGTLHY